MSTQRLPKSHLPDCAQSYLLGSFEMHATMRFTEAEDHVRSNDPDPLRGRVPSASILQSPSVEKASDPGGTPSPAQQPLHHRGDAAHPPLPDVPRARTDRVERPQLGSVSERVVKYPPCSLLVTRGPHV